MILFFLLFGFGTSGALAGQPHTPPDVSTNTTAPTGTTNQVGGLFGAVSANGAQSPVNLRPFQLVLPREHLFGDWAGYRTQLENDGFFPTLTFVSDIAGNVSGGKSQGVSEADNLGLNLLFDLEKLAHIDGASFLVTVSQRSGSSLSADHVGNVFTIQQVYGGQTFHVIDVAWQQQLWDDRVEFSLGRIAAGDDFLVSPYDWVFMQNAFDGNPVGIFLNSPGMTAYPNATWGARVKVKPTERTYLMAGIYNGDPAIREIAHDGADLSMDGPVFLIAEAGYQANGLPGDTGLIGNYKVGFWYDNSTYTDYRTVGYSQPAGTARGNWGVYGLFDQVLVSFGSRTNNSGLGVCASILASPDGSISQMPFFCTAGVVARGFWASRIRDVAGLGFVYGEFSSDLRHAQEREQLFNPAIGPQNHEMVVEGTYRFYFRKSSIFFQPDVQCIINPGGTGKIDDALVLGCQIGFF